MPEDIATGLTTQDGRPVYVRRSARRRRTVSAFWEDGRAVVAVPASFSARQERDWVAKMVLRLQSQRGGKRPARSDQELLERSLELSKKYLGNRPQPSSVRWVSNQRSRWGSATPADGSIRISVQLRGMPQWVVDYVLLHELTHLLVASHSPEFWRELESYPDTERAKAFLEGVSFASTRGLSGDYLASGEA
ncbi:M48 family metallopeptidase [Psychromicrobium lacuslunae]|uniref:Metal-dependent hydrolase n=1 Tax=Psychromicrobium lacuslunae TaxID=1618207 RepID=A0A0D4BYW8_9MICC|nr:M48 family metallopeptidase [Psychromicrobium lacuslunae]AJT41518.1 metal-dependent hydrolase [Psychromicrobium lacuslunae]